MSYNPITHPPGAKNPSDDLIFMHDSSSSSSSRGLGGRPAQPAGADSVVTVR